MTPIPHKAEPAYPTDFNRLETLTLDWLYVEFNVHPRHFRAMTANVESWDELGMDAAIRDGLTKLDPALADYAYLFINAIEKHRRAA